MASGGRGLLDPAVTSLGGWRLQVAVNHTKQAVSVVASRPNREARTHGSLHHSRHSVRILRQPE
jgi:hypothetical protein